MKKLLILLQLFCLTVTVNAQQTEDEVHIGSYPKGKTFGNYNGPDTKPIEGLTTITGTVINVGRFSRLDSITDKRGGFYSFDLKKDDGTMITVITSDNRFTVPKEIIGNRIIVQGTGGDKVSGGRKRRDVPKESEADGQFAAAGIKVLD